MKTIRHGLLDCGTNISKAKGYDTIRKGTLRSTKSSPILVLGMYLNLVIIKETVHKGNNFMSCVSINELVNEGCGIIFFWDKPG